MRDEIFELQVAMYDATVGPVSISGTGPVIVEAVDALLMNPRLRSFKLERVPKVDPVWAQVDNDGASMPGPS